MPKMLIKQKGYAMSERPVQHTKSERRRLLLNLLYILITFGVIIAYGMLNPEIKDISGVVSSLSPIWLLVGVGALLIYWLMDAVVLHMFLRCMQTPISLGRAFHVSMVGFYYSALTPFSSGGQPAQVLYLKQDGISVGKGTCVFSLKFIVFQVAVSSFFILGMLLRGPYIFEHYNHVFYLTLLGLVINVGLMILVIFVMVDKRRVGRFADKVLHLLGRIRLVKNLERAAETTHNMLNDFHNSASCANAHRPHMIIGSFISFFQLTCYYFITYCIYRAMGLAGTSALDIVILQAFLFLTVSFVPLPGAALASEGGFILFFGAVFPGAELVYTATLVWRLLTYYSNLLVGGGFVLGESVFRLFRKKASPPSPPAETS